MITKGMERKIRPAGYVSMPRLLEINRDALRAMDRPERLIAGRRLIREVAGWCALTNEEALGLLESAKFEFLVAAETMSELREKRNQKR